MFIQIEIIENANAVQSRSFTNQKTGEIKQYYNQYGYVHLGEAFPIKMKVPVESPAQAYPVGKYQLSLQSIRVGRFDALEIDPYNIILEPLQANK